MEMGKMDTTYEAKTNVSGHVEDTSMEFERVDVQILKVDKPGDYFVGIYVEQSKRPWKQINKKTGEVIEKEITQLHFTDTKGANPFIVFADAGLQNAMMTTNIKKGDIVKAIKGEKLALESGQSVNQWAILKPKTDKVKH
jgi:hypothetical protein